MRNKSIPVLLTEYRNNAIHNADYDHPAKANRAFDRIHACYKLLRESEEGRQGIMALMDDPVPEVRGWAAAHSLFCDEARARAVLLELHDKTKYGLEAFDAYMTLHEFDAGRLTFEF